MKLVKIQIFRASVLLVAVCLAPFAYSAEVVEDTSNCDWQALNPADPTAVPLTAGSSVGGTTPTRESGTFVEPLKTKTPSVPTSNIPKSTPKVVPLKKNP